MLNGTRVRVGSLFTGIGGFDKAFEDLGCILSWQVENDKFCLELLERYWSGVPKYGDIRNVPHGSLGETDIICGGDPCTIRSRVRPKPCSSRNPDLSGYFLAVVGSVRPRWVVRENVFAPDAKDFAAALELLGYGAVSVGLDSRDFTSQSRRRQFIVGCPIERTPEFKQLLSRASRDPGLDPARSEQVPAIAACLTAHPHSVAPHDTYCWEGPTRGLRTLTPAEQESLQGFPRGWTAGFSRARRWQMLGNAVTVPVVKWLGERILECEGRKWTS